MNWEKGYNLMTNKHMAIGEDPKKDLLWLALVFIGFGILWAAAGRPSAGVGSSSPFVWSPIRVPTAEVNSNSKPSSGSSGSVGIVAYDPDNKYLEIDGWTYEKSPWYHQVRIGRGTASSATRANYEYLVLSAGRTLEPITISGWVLENGRSRRTYELNGRKVYWGKSARVTIPLGVELLLEKGKPATYPIVLEKGERAIITTGYSPRNSAVVGGTSFRVNKCSGYLEDENNVDFTPRLSASCPRPANDLETSSLPKDCYNFVKRLKSCHTPDTKPFRDSEGDLVRNHLDRVTGLSAYCRTFVLDRYNYSACLGQAINDKDFYRPEWRIFLKQAYELWDKEREVITLYDSSGRLVDQIKY